MFKKILLTVIVLGLVISGGFPVYANGHDKENILNNQHENSIDSGYESTDEIVINSRVNRHWLRVAWEIAKIAGGKLFQQSETVYQGPEYDQISSGTVYYNQGETGSVASHVVNIDDAGYLAYVWAERQNPFAIYTDEILLIFRDPRGGRYDEYVKHKQYMYYSPSAQTVGLHTADFVEQRTNTRNWNLWVRLYHWDGPCYGDNPCPESNEPIVMTSLNGEVIHLHSEKENRIYEVVQGNKKNFLIETKYGTFTLPSNYENRVNNLKKSDSINPTLTLAQLYEDVFDVELNDYVRFFNSFVPGDTVIFKDKLLSLEYDERYNVTYFEFSDGLGGSEKWSFKGDLTNTFTANEYISLKFTVVNIGDVAYLETLDYIYEGLLTGEAPNIDDYLVK